MFVPAYIDDKWSGRLGSREALAEQLTGPADAMVHARPKSMLWQVFPDKA